jgi:hypothetical protein
MMGSTAVPPCPSAVTGTNTFFPMPFTAAFHFARSGGIRPPGAYLSSNSLYGFPAMAALPKISEPQCSRPSDGL